ncbi:hypothetical protein HAX54_025608, partial [Datura stramonium]|nr:hypothetical protein [Datura stramonium]
KGNEHPNYLHSYNGCKGLLIVDVFLLVIALNHQMGFVPCECSLLIQLVLKHLLSITKMKESQPIPEIV